MRVAKGYISDSDEGMATNQGASVSSLGDWICVGRQCKGISDFDQRKELYALYYFRFKVPATERGPISSIVTQVGLVDRIAPSRFASSAKAPLSFKANAA